MNQLEHCKKACNKFTKSTQHTLAPFSTSFQFSFAESPHESVIVPAQGFSAHHRRVKSLKEPRAKTRRAKPGNEPLSETLSCLDLHKARDEGQLPRSSARPDSSLTRTMRWLQKYTSPGSLSPRSLQSSVSSLARDGSSSSSSTEAGNATLSPRYGWSLGRAAENRAALWSSSLSSFRQN